MAAQERLSLKNIRAGGVGSTTGKTSSERQRQNHPEEFQMDQRQNSSEDEAAVRAVVETWLAAIRRRDMEGIVQNHSPDFVMFDVPPPFQSGDSKPTGQRGTCSIPGQAIRSSSNLPK